jgi:hypothetical protein
MFRALGGAWTGDSISGCFGLWSHINERVGVAHRLGRGLTCDVLEPVCGGIFAPHRLSRADFPMTSVNYQSGKVV